VEEKEGAPGTEEEGVAGKKGKELRWGKANVDDVDVVSPEEAGRLAGAAGCRQKVASSCMNSTNSRNSIMNSLHTRTSTLHDHGMMRTIPLPTHTLTPARVN
jgi:hypothetical protein